MIYLPHAIGMQGASIYLLFPHAKLSAAQMGKDGVAPPEPEGNRFTVCPATIYGIFPLVRFPLRLSLPPRVCSNYGRFSAGLLILCKESATLTSSGSYPAKLDRQELNLHIRHTIAAKICTSFLGPSLPQALPLSYCPKQSQKESNLPYYSSLCGFVLRLLLSHRADLRIFQHYW